MSGKGFLLAIGFVLASSVLCWGCAECAKDADCAQGKVCSSGECKAGPPADAGKDASDTSDTSDTSDASDTGTGTGTDTGIDTGTSTDTGTDTEADAGADAGTDTGAQPLADGAACGGDTECKSGHCGGGFCCKEGECCGTPGTPTDCDETLCVQRFCDGNFECHYYNMACGALDLSDGLLCQGASRCNAEGGCATLSGCTGAYAGSETYVCEAGGVAEECFVACTDENQCNAGYRCTGDDCLPKLDNGSKGCEQNQDCESGHCYAPTQSCCDFGICCSQDADCAPWGCNESIWVCLDSCTVGGLDEDSACATGSHCDSGWCVENLRNGAYYCDEASDCSSTYCDVSNGICCVGGHCCTDNEDCDGFTCDKLGGFICVENCAPQGPDNDALCDEGFHCESGACVESYENGSECERGGQCESAHCGDGFCCAQGECCFAASDCDRSTCVTRTCDGNKECTYYNMGCGSADLSDGGTCSSGSLCDGFEGCVAVAACTTGYMPDGDYSCSQGSVHETCKTTCTGDGDCVFDWHCDSPSCLPDLADGEDTCDSNLDCASGNCNVFTGVCCDSGYCCNDNGQCSGLADLCETATWSCVTSCDSGGSDDDALCAPLGDFHCDEGVCMADLGSGEGACNESSDCVSGYCDAAAGICCDAGTCCADDLGCDGFLCDPVLFHCGDDCNPLGTEDDGLCVSGYHCDGHACVPDLPDGESGCDESSDCESGKCTVATGVCCTGAGTCCNDEGQCSDGNPCTTDTCGAGFHCSSSAKGDGELCSDGVFCNGNERCYGGVCTPGSSPCGYLEGLCRVVSCNESGRSCSMTPSDEGEDCSEPLWCLGGEKMVCSGGACVDPGTGTPPCTGSTGAPCTVYDCNENDQLCDEVPGQDGISCNDSDPCNGEDLCEDGACAHGGNPCEDGNPCTADECTDVDGGPECGAHTPRPDLDPCDDGLCAGYDAFCVAGSCIPGETRPCNDGNACNTESCAIVGGVAECSPPGAVTPAAISCGGSVELIGDDFGARDYYEYNATCAGELPGKEALIAVNMALAGNATITVSGATPAMDVDIMYMGDACDPLTCLATGTNALAVTLPAGASSFVLEGGDGLPPESLTVQVSCP
ncbi:MAG: hypothetical protein PHU25_11255 [Deltaproteobacteria bacterium]|nr:hypothetical protein [Deltaproteobacteria bacterium]